MSLTKNWTAHKKCQPYWGVWIPPPPLCQQFSAICLHPLPPLSVIVSIWQTQPPSRLCQQCQHLAKPLPFQVFTIFGHLARQPLSAIIICLAKMLKLCFICIQSIIFIHSFILNGVYGLQQSLVIKINF